ncbi:ynaJ [Symbiodinium sp. CCMP2456]|nr:ynaJ [Symbiodinium sp. CCMP2456]
MRQRVAYGALDFAKTPVQLLISVHLLTFYQQAGASLGAIAFFTSTARCFDVLSDPLMAQISDGFSSRFGRRRPFVFAGCLLYGGCLLALCTPPESLSGASTGVWFGCFYILFFLTDTLMSIPHNALGQEITSDTDQRRLVFMVAKIFQALGMIAAAALPVLLGTLSADCKLPAECHGTAAEDHCAALERRCDGIQSRQAMLATGLIFGGVAVASGFACVAVIRERKPVREGEDGLLQHRSPGNDQPTKLDEILPGFLAMLQNRPFRAMIAPWILDQTIVAMLSSSRFAVVSQRVLVRCHAHRCAHVVYLIWFNSFRSCVLFHIVRYLASCEQLGIGLVCMLLAAIFSMPLWQRAAMGFGDYQTWLAFNFLNAITTILFIVGQTSTLAIVLTICFAILNGAPIGASFLTDNILGLVIDYDELRTGERNEATFTMFASFIPKVVSVPASAFPLTILAVLGFRDPVNGELQEQPEQVRWGVRLMFSVVPTLLALTSFALKGWLFPFKDLARADAEIKAGLALRKLGEPYRDPLDASYRHPDKLSDQNPAQADHLRVETLLSHFSGLEVSGSQFAAGRVYLSYFRPLAGRVADVCEAIDIRNMLSWLPSILVLLTGLGILASLVAGLRLRAALALRKLLPDLPSGYLEAASTRRTAMLQARNICICFPLLSLSNPMSVICDCQALCDFDFGFLLCEGRGCRGS